jgi:hypothetical protein
MLKTRISNRYFGQKAQGGNDMNRVDRMVPFRTVPILLIVAVLLAAGGFVAGANWSAGTRTGLAMPSAPESEAVIGVEAEAGVDAPQLAPSTSRDWLLEEPGAGSPGVLEENERTFEGLDPTLWHEFMRHKLGLGSGMDPTLWHEFMEFKRNREPGLQPGI